MSYCRHENTARDLDDVWENWQDTTDDLNEYEVEGRKRIIRLVQEMNEHFESNGVYEEEGLT